MQIIGSSDSRKNGTTYNTNVGATCKADVDRGDYIFIL